MDKTDRLEKIRSEQLEYCISEVEHLYGVEGYGIAELIGMSKWKWTRNQNLPWGKKNISLFLGLSELAGVSLSWLIAEDVADACE